MNRPLARLHPATRLIALALAMSAPLAAPLAVSLAVSPAAAHIVREEPWHPVAAAYRSTVFLADLTPVPWQQAADA